MPSMKRFVIPLIITIAIVCLSSSVKSEDVRERELLCNEIVIADGRDKEGDITHLVTWLLDQTPVQGFSQHLTYHEYYGHAACNGKISIDDCDYCLDYAKNEIFKACGFGEGAQIKLVDCRLRYERYDFPNDW